MSKNINFRARSRTEFEVQPKPFPAVKQLPKWFVNANPYSGGDGYPNDNKLHFRNKDANATYKKCVPLLDGLSAGYIIPLWTDVMVEQHGGIPDIYCVGTYTFGIFVYVKLELKYTPVISTPCNGDLSFVSFDIASCILCITECII
jgi:hypothetical protein